MSQITGGSVTYERRVKTGDYEHKHLACTLTFTIDEGDTKSSLDEVARSRAIVLVEQGLRAEITDSSIKLPGVDPAKVVAADPPSQTTVKPPRRKPVVAPPLTNDVVHEDPAAIEGQVNAGKTRTVAELQAKAPEGRKLAVIGTGVHGIKMLTPTVALLANNGQERTLWPDGQKIEKDAEGNILEPLDFGPGAKVDPAAMNFPSDSKAAGNAELISGAVPPGGIDRTAPAIDWEQPVGPVEITNDGLVKACNSATARGVNAENIRKLLPSYGAEKLSVIPQEKRAAFLLELGKL
jgi:hypothetical protein